jgi:hypothetical protein
VHARTEQALSQSDKSNGDQGVIVASSGKSNRYVKVSEISRPMKSAFVGTLKFAATGMRKPHPLHRPAQNSLHNNISVLNSTGHAFIPRTKSLVAFNSRIQTRSNSQLAKPSDQNKLHGRKFKVFTVILVVFVCGLMGHGLMAEKHDRDMKFEARKAARHARIYGDQ